MKNTEHPRPKASSSEIDLVDLFAFFWQQKKFIATTSAIAGAIALGYVLIVPSIYQASSVLRPAENYELDALNRSEVYKLPPQEALLKVGAALDSYEMRLNFFLSHQDLFKPLEKDGMTLEQSFELFNRDSINLTQIGVKNPDALSPSVKLELTYPKSVKGVEIINQFIDYAINNQRAQISADLKTIINNRQKELREKIEAARLGYQSDKEAKIATLEESDELARANLKDELEALRLQLKAVRDARIQALDEAISIASNLGITRPTTPYAMGENGGAGTRVIRTEVTTQDTPLYFLGTQALQAERAVLLKRSSDDFTDKRVQEIDKQLKLLEVNRQVELLGKRSNEDVFLKNIEPLRAEIVRLGNLNTDMQNLVLVSIDRKAQPPISPLKPKKTLTVLMGLFLGGLLGLGISVVRYFNIRRREEAGQSS
ncbi:Wzz/FepE/Etk N-terminal domain-containing protein [Pseudomonas sp. 7P_10.2_Bac1]|uniref:Wzz/FepE/Etk N-terminal domain-containing protein n=1 Tax=Pseudomonas sp. 7P_10.2_Bac1 TaxID=2971614 RepID=UPI0021C8037A|nr:Wzz/FepE/Etk N-terminal domain-containing protein [Pseudomonas sp. 7P_10.2_Bac1]MCU1729424.1 Wzz/FepE/Etk N-terminal domain-containing protein [Pseudomonas sp. 7P_10.2_Bac1]